MERTVASLHLVDDSPSRFSIRVLGGFALFRDGHRVETTGWQRRPLALLRLLAASGGSVSRDDVIEYFWPESEPEKGAASLRQVLYLLRSQLGAEPPPVIVEDNSVTLNPALHWDIDLARFHTAAETAGDDLDALEAALDLWQGEPLAEDRYEDWAAPIRQHLQNLARATAISAIKLHCGRGTAESALPWIDLLLGLDPLDEEAVRLQLEVLAEAGRRPSAIRAYRDFERRLRAELAIEPEEETRTLVEKIQRRDMRAPRVERVPAKGPAVPTPTNLPAAVSSFIGRINELEWVRSLLARDGTRLLTLTGPGGTGKTRLALEAASRSLDPYPDGVFFVGLAPVRHASLIPATIASALGIRETGSDDLLDVVRLWIGSKRLLLVVDNCEHVLEAAPQFSTLVIACPQLVVLATSRERLRLYGERVYPVPPLSLPNESASVETVGASEAVALFVDRAQAVDPDFVLDAGVAPAVAGICRKLDGLPLALELAAARIGDLAPGRLLARLDDRLGALSDGPRDLPERQQTLRATIDWSFSLLSATEQTLFARLGVFAGGCTSEAALQVCDSEGELGLPDALDNLAHKSLVRQEERAGDRWFGMLETMREYAIERLRESGSEALLRDRHVEYYIELVRAAMPGMRGPEQGHWLDVLEREHDNVRAALDWSRDRGPERGLQIVRGIWRFWDRRGYLSEGRGRLDDFLARTAEHEVDPYLRANALLGSGSLASSQGSYKEALELLGESLRLWRQLGDGASIAAALNNMTGAAMHRGDYDRARELGEECLAITRELGNTHRLALILNILGTVAGALEEYERASALFQESLQLAREVGDAYSVAIALTNLGSVAERLGEYEQAADLQEESLSLARQLGSKEHSAACLNALGIVAEHQGKYVRAAELHGSSLRLKHELGNTPGIATSLNDLGVVAGLHGEHERAARLIGAADTLWEDTVNVLEAGDRQRRDETANAVSAAMGAEAYEAARARGRAMSMEVVIQYALAEPG